MDMFEKDWGEKIKSDDDTQPENGGATEGVDAGYIAQIQDCI